MKFVVSLVFLIAAQVSAAEVPVWPQARTDLLLATDAPTIDETAFYFALKRRINPDGPLSSTSTGLQREDALSAGYVAFDDCNDWNKTISTNVPEMLLELANEVVDIRQSLQGVADDDDWRNTLVWAEEHLLARAVNGNDITWEIELLEYQLADNLNQIAHFSNPDAVPVYIAPDASECGDGPTVGVEFSTPNNRYVEYRAATIHFVCESGVSVPAGYCEWREHRAGTLNVFGDLMIRLNGSEKPAHLVTASSEGQVIPVTDD